MCPVISGKRLENGSRARRSRQWADYLLAILGGNVLFLLLEPRLPAPFRHQIFRIDAGLGLDFAICVGLYGLIRLASARKWLKK